MLGRLSLSTELAGYRPSIRADALASVSTPIFQTATFDVSAQGTIFLYRPFKAIQMIAFHFWGPIHKVVGEFVCDVSESCLAI